MRKKQKTILYPVLEPKIGAREKKYVLECIDSGWISSNGKYVKQFENAYASFNETRFAAAVSNGTVSLHLIMLALGIKEGDEVIVPDFTYVATANAVRYVGATPIFADCDKETFNILPSEIEKKITARTRAIIVTHLYGNPCDMKRIAAIAKKHKLHLVEDAAEAHGAYFGNRMVGTFGIANSYSFFGNKIMSTGEGGMITTDSSRIFKTISLLRNQGQRPNARRYFHDVLAYNYRMTNLQAAVGLAQLEQLDLFLRQKRKLHDTYKKFLAPLVENGSISFQKETPGSTASWWVTGIILNTKSAEHVAKKLLQSGVDTRPFFYPMHRLPHLRQRGSFRNADRVAKHGLILPSSVRLTTSDIRKISDAVIHAVQ